MRKNAAYLLAVLLVAVFAMTACKDGAVNQKPIINGLQEEYSVEAGSEFNALAGVTASDPEDGDLTAKIVVTSLPELVFVGGKTTPTQPGDYDLMYSVTDSAGENFEAFATLHVARKAVETLFKKFDFSESYTDQIDTNGWELTLGGAAAGTAEAKNGRMEIEVTNPGAGIWEAAYTKSGFHAEANASYEMRAYLSASKEVEFNFATTDVNFANLATPGAVHVFGGKLDGTVRPYSTKFKTTEAVDSIKFTLQLGKTDLNAGPYTVYIEKIELFEITGEEVAEQIYAEDFTEEASIEQAAKTAYDPVSTLSLADGKLKFDIPSYPADRNAVWERSFSLKTDADLVAGNTYRLEADVTATAAQTAYINYENAALEFSSRAGQSTATWEAGENKLSVTFTALVDLENMALHIQLGNAPAETVSNVLTMDNIRFYSVSGADVQKHLLRFIPYDGSVFDVYNGSDDNSGNNGIGRIYRSGESLVYHISEVGDVGYFNKLFLSKFALDAMAEYRVEFKLKASAEVSANMLVNKSDAGYDPIILQVLNVTTEYQTFSFKTDRMIMVEFPYDFIFEFGGTANQGKGEITVEFAELAIYKIA